MGYMTDYDMERKLTEQRRVPPVQGGQGRDESDVRQSGSIVLAVAIASAVGCILALVWRIFSAVA